MRSICSGVARVSLCVLVAAPGVYASSRGPERSAPQAESQVSAPQTGHVVPPALLDAAVQQQVSATERDRETVRLFLQRDQVRAVAGKAGIDISRADTAVAAMDASELALLAERARQADQALAGGASTITISTTTIIIVLLIVILIAVL